MRSSTHIPHMPLVSVPKSGPLAPRPSSLLALLGLAVVFAATSATGQSPTPPAPVPVEPAQPAPTAGAPEHPQPSGEINEDQLRQLLVGKQLFLRGGYLGDSLSFNEHGDPTGHPTAGSYTLSGVEIEKVHLTRHKVELIGDRYAPCTSLPAHSPTKIPPAVRDRVKITPKKKVLRITIDREQVVKEKKAKEPAKGKSAKPIPSTPVSGQPVASSETDVAAAPAWLRRNRQPHPSQPQKQPRQKTKPTRPPTPPASPPPLRLRMRAQVLRSALGKVFAQGLDDKVRAQMPEFWQLYYQAQAEGVAFRAKDPHHPWLRPG